MYDNQTSITIAHLEHFHGQETSQSEPVAVLR